MRIILAGGSGFLGRALQQRLEGEGHAVAVLTRRPRPGQQQDIAWTPDGTSGPWSSAIDGVDAVVNLAGEGIADRRWNAARKQALRESRLLATRSLVAAIRSVAQPPRVLVSGSAVGYYGARGDEFVTESTSPGTDFLAQLCVEWEREAQAAAPLTRVTLVRTGQVLDPGGGMIAKLLLPFKLGLGGPLGSGTQYLPWIHIDDWIDMVLWLVVDERADGPFNNTAPNPVTNAEFTRTLGRVLQRPAFIPVPSFALHLAVGELAASILTGQRAIPARAGEMGFQFRFPMLEAALRDLIQRS